MEGHLRYKDKVTVITGGSSGIGKGCATVFVQQGSKVVFCSYNEKEGKEAERELNDIGPGEALFIFADVTKEDDIKNLINKAVERYGKIDCVINNAGQHPEYRTIDNYTAEEFRKLFEVNVLGYFLVSKYALPHLRKTEGNIINNSSMTAHTAAGWCSVYCATKYKSHSDLSLTFFSSDANTSNLQDSRKKGAVSAMTRALAIDEAKYNVRVNSFSGGNIDTPLSNQFINSTANPDETGQIFSNISLLGRRGTAEECGMTSLYLASDATFSTGIDIHVSGGAELNYACKNVNTKEFWPNSFLKKQ
ncbi:17-beta-hydroxysteroid dehydrogenase 14 [Mytilus coruscus]|uniref:17-beta-hydroxysteroid dehydrogenase 14 n=1 Tax=Mytilus coruscus TaxID=42192 RepID=A0A6J8AIQ0_MYTCO|nr:17-beta-hydroxysteroid dehydrogenase 14 [Mytilus coruscus]